MPKKLTQNIIIVILTVAVAMASAACTLGTSAAPNGEQNTPVATSVVPATPEAAVDTTPQQTNRSTLVIDEPTAGAVIGEKVTVRGGGIAFENQITVEVLAGNNSVGKSVVTTNAQPGEIGQFSTTVVLGPVAEDTDGLVTIYTNSPKDGSIDQRASVAVKLVAHGKATPSAARGNHPNIAISPTRGRPGTEVTVVGGGFPPDSIVQIRLGGLTTGTDRKVYAETQAGQHGNIQASFIMPDHWGTGEPIASTQVTIVAATPDFVTKATAQYNFDTSPTPTEGQNARVP